MDKISVPLYNRPIKSVQDRRYRPLTREELLSRGKCCHHNCRNCPYKDELKNNANLPSST